MLLDMLTNSKGNFTYNKVGQKLQYLRLCKSKILLQYTSHGQGPKFRSNHNIINEHYNDHESRCL